MDDAALITGAIIAAFGLIAWMSTLPVRYLRGLRATEPIDHTVVLDVPLGEALALAQAVAARGLARAGFSLDVVRSDELRWTAPREAGSTSFDELLSGTLPGLMVRGTILGARTALEIRGDAPCTVAARLRGLVAAVPLAATAPEHIPAAASAPVSVAPPLAVPAPA